MGAHELAFIGLAGSGLGTVLGVPMVWPRTRRPLDVRLLGSAVLLMSVIAALISARLAGLAPVSAFVEHTINLLGLCAFPLLVLYTRYTTQLAITPRVLACCLSPVAVYAAVAIGRAALGAETRVPFIWLLPVVLGFTAVSVATICRAGARRRAGVVPAEWVVAFVVVVNIAQIVRMQFGHIAPIRALVPIALSIGFVAMAAFAVWRVISLVRTSEIQNLGTSEPQNCGTPEPRNLGTAEPRNPGTAEPRPPAPPRYEHSGLDEARVPDLLQRIELVLTRDRLFARADLTLAHLAAAVGVTPHQVSEVLNRHAGVSFNDLINRRRVEDVKAQLLEPTSERFTIEGIGQSAGFGSRSALYAAFRRFEGMTPTAFRTSQRP